MKRVLFLVLLLSASVEAQRLFTPAQLAGMLSQPRTFRPAATTIKRDQDLYQYTRDEFHWDGVIVGTLVRYPAAGWMTLTSAYQVGTLAPQRKLLARVNDAKLKNSTQNIYMVASGPLKGHYLVEVLASGKPYYLALFTPLYAKTAYGDPLMRQRQKLGPQEFAVSRYLYDKANFCKLAGVNCG